MAVSRWIVIGLALAAQARELPVITISGSGYQRGLDHGKQLRQRVRTFVEAWKQSIQERCKREPDVFLAEFRKRFDFLPAVKQWAPELLAEVRGIADGSGVPFDDIFALQLLNDELWVNGNAICRDRCSALGIRDSPASFVAQNMDLQGWLDGHQIVLRVREESGLESLVLSHVGLIGLAGVNQAGVGVVVNALTQLRHRGEGLPVAFVIRGLLERKSYQDAVEFLRRVPHATGQNYIVGTPEAVGSFEASAGGVAEYLPNNAWPALFHTNHPLASRDFVPGYVPGRGETNTVERMRSLGSRLASRPSGKVLDVIKDALRAKDSEQHPVCRRFTGRTNSFTLGSVIFELSANPAAYFTAGPPDESEYQRLDFSKKSVARSVRVCATQPRSRLIDYRLKAAEALAEADKSLDALEQMVHRAGEAGCDVVAFPEDTLGLLHWEVGNNPVIKDVLPAAVARMLKRLGAAAAAHHMYLVCSNDTWDKSGTYRNTAFFLGRDGKEIGRYHKVQPTINESNRKRGEGFPVFETPDLGGVGMLICYDMVMPESVRSLVMGGADIIFNPTLGGAVMGDGELNRAAFRVRALDNFVYLVVAKRGGGAMIVSPKGKILAEGKGPDGMAMADIDPFGDREAGDALNSQTDMRARLFRERNPAAYRILTDPNPPVLKKIPATITIEEAVRVGGKTLTVGNERFNEAENLLKAGKAGEAIAAFEKLCVEFPKTWIDRLSRERLAKIRSTEVK